MNGRFNSGLLVVIAALLLGLGGVAAPNLLAAGQHQIKLDFATADGLVDGSDVLESGARIGTVEQIEPRANDTAVVTVAIDDANWPLHKGVTASIRPKSLLGEEYVAITDGSSAEAFNPNKAIPTSDTQTPVELDQFIDSLDPTTRVAAQTLLDDFGAGVAGQGENLNAAIAAGTQDLQHLAVTGQTLDNRDPQLDQILVSLDAVLQKLTTTDQLTQLSQLITNGQTTLDAVEQQQAAFSRSFSDASVTLDQLNTAIDSAVPNLRTALSVGPQLTSNLQDEASLMEQVTKAYNDPNVLAALDAGLVHGPTTSGGALEVHSDGTTLPIFRICLVVPVPGSCTGSGSFSGEGPSGIPADDTGGPQMAEMAAWIAS